MKRIGILTFHRAHNYGAVLQCYALQEVLKSMGHEVWIIDYRQPYTEEIYKVFTMRLALNRLMKKGIRSYIKKIPTRIKQKKHFESFNERNLHLTESCFNNIPSDFDCYVIGSDQLWSKRCLGNSFDKIFLGDFQRKPEQKLIGYAISSNLTSLNSIEDSLLKQIIENFTIFSMREEKNVNLVKQKTGLSTIESCIDPTLLTNVEIWNKKTNSRWANEDYILIYQVRYSSQYPNILQEKAQELSKEFNNCKVIRISPATHSVEDFLSLFKYAKYVLTTSFHATVFSIIFETPFYAIKLKDGHDDRYENLLSQIGANELCVDMDFKAVKKNIDFKPIKNKLKEIQSQSLSFLERI